MPARGRTARTALAVLAAVLLLVPPATAAEYQDEAAAQRFAGEGRMETAAMMAAAAFPAGAEEALLARADAFADALAGAYLAGRREAPLLLTRSVSLPDVTAQALADLGVATVVLLGGPGAISPEVEQELVEAGYTVERIGGASRYETARLIVEAGGGDIGTTEVIRARQLRTAFLATGEDFPDALAAGPWAYWGAHPLLLTPTATLGEDARAALTDAELNIERVFVLGGPAAVSEETVAAVRDLGIDAFRLAGEDRTATAQAVADAALAETGTATARFAPTHVAVATGRDFPDALAVAPLAGELTAPLILAAGPNNLGMPGQGFLAGVCATTDTLLIAGGEAVMGPGAVNGAVAWASCFAVFSELDGDQVVGEGDPDGNAVLQLRIYPLLEPSQFCYGLVADRIGPATAAHIHRGAAGETGPAVVTLNPPEADTTGGQAVAAECRESVDPDLIDEISHNPENFYVDVHTADFPDGAIRGQLATFDPRASQEDTGGSANANNPAA